MYSFLKLPKIESKQEKAGYSYKYKIK